MQLRARVLLTACGVPCSIKHMLRLPHSQAAGMVEGFAQGLFQRMAGPKEVGTKVCACLGVSLQPAERCWSAGNIKWLAATLC